MGLPSFFLGKAAVAPLGRKMEPVCTKTLSQFFFKVCVRSFGPSAPPSGETGRAKPLGVLVLGSGALVSGIAL